MQKQVALVTGGLGDLGTAICHALAKLDYQVVAVDKKNQNDATSWQQQQKQNGYDFAYVQADITQYPSCEKMIEEVENNIGNIAILVNNAGINRDALFKKMTPEQWNAVLRTDLDSLFNVTRPAINRMCQGNFGRIINIASVSGQLGQFGQTNYSAAKAGVHGFTKSLAREVARYGITVNTISPGFIQSRMVGNIPEDIQQQVIKQTPVGRLGKPEEIAWAVGFLAAKNSAFITGANLAVNGGFHMY
ncbi:MAG: acetoacetyl-CoA reductase [Pseudomonadota bacterium]